MKLVVGLSGTEVGRWPASAFATAVSRYVFEPITRQATSEMMLLKLACRAVSSVAAWMLRGAELSESEVVSICRWPVNRRIAYCARSSQNKRTDDYSVRLDS